MSPSSRPARHLPRTSSFGVLLASLLFVLAACSGAATTSVAPSPSAVAVATVAPTLAPTATPAPTASPTPAPAFPATLTDDEGTVVTLKAEPQKIVSLTPAATETLFALGAGPRVIATTAADDYPPAAVALPDVATFTSVDVEKIVGMEADLVVAGGNFFNPPEAIKSLRDLGVPVLVIYAPDVAGALKDITLLGSAVGLPEQATALTTALQTEFDAITAATTALSKPRTFYEIDVSTGPIYTVADGSVYVEMITKAGGAPITTGSKTDYAIPLEKLIEADPELILLGDAAYNVTAEQVKARPGWNVMTAIKNGAIWPIDDILVTRPGPRMGEGLRALAMAIHPDLVLPPAVPIPAVP